MARLTRWLLALALLLMPIGMIPGPASAAAPAVAAHCADLAPASHPAPLHSGHWADCAIACSAVPSIAGMLTPPELVPALLHPLPLATGHGLAPEAATPPPRFR